jgi:hypothetical protein
MGVFYPVYFDDLARSKPVNMDTHHQEKKLVYELPLYREPYKTTPACPECNYNILTYHLMADMYSCKCGARFAKPVMIYETNSNI